METLKFLRAGENLWRVIQIERWCKSTKGERSIGSVFKIKEFYYKNLFSFEGFKESPIFIHSLWMYSLLGIQSTKSIIASRID